MKYIEKEKTRYFHHMYSWIIFQVMYIYIILAYKCFLPSLWNVSSVEKMIPTDCRYARYDKCWSFVCLDFFFFNWIIESHWLLGIWNVTLPFLRPGESPVPPPSTVSSSALSTSAVAPPPQPKQGNASQQDRKVPPPIGTERLARIRQTGSVNPPLLTTGYTASVGQGGIWSYGVGSASGKKNWYFTSLFLFN